MRRRWVYGAAVPALTYNETGLVNGDTLSGLLATTATTTSNVGAYAITQGTLAASTNYALSYVGANLTVTAAPLTVTANAQSRIYGAANPTLTYTDTGLVNGDTLSGLLATTATTTSNVGSYGITPRHARRFCQLRPELCRRQSHRDRGTAHRHRQCADHGLRQRRSGPDL